MTASKRIAVAAVAITAARVQMSIVTVMLVTHAGEVVAPAVAVGCPVKVGGHCPDSIQGCSCERREYYCATNSIFECHVPVACIKHLTSFRR